MIWQKTKVIENRDKSKITKHLIVPICFCQRDSFYIFFTNLIISKIFLSLFQVFFMYLSNTSMTNSDKYNNLFCAWEIAKFSE